MSDPTESNVVPGPGVTPEHNAKAVYDAQNNAFKEMLDYQKQIDALTEKHITPLKDLMTTVRRDLKSDTDVDWADHKPFYDLFKRQESIKDFEDEEERSKSIDAMRTAFAAMKWGKTLDFLDVLERGHTPAGVEDVSNPSGGQVEAMESGPTGAAP